MTIAHLRVDHRQLRSAGTAAGSAHDSSPFAGSHRGIDGATALRESTDNVPAHWGEGDAVLWAQSEPLMIAGPDGIGKTTLGQQVALCPGDLVVELRHLKQPAEDVGPLTLVHDHARGQTIVQDHVDLVALVALARAGLTVHEAATAMTGNPAPERNEIEKARRKLESLRKKNLVVRRDDDIQARYHPPQPAA